MNTESSRGVSAVVSATPAQSRRSSLTLWLILAVCVAPIIGSTALYYLAPPKSRMNYGELITPNLFPEAVLDGLDGRSVRLGELRGKWIMVQVDDAACATRCRDKLYKMRQVRLTQGKNMDRVQRLWVVSDDAAVTPDLLAEYSGTVVVRAGHASPNPVLEALPAASADALHEHIWLVDPLGNVMLRYPPDADPSGMKKDLYRLLQVSRVE